MSKRIPNRDVPAKWQSRAPFENTNRTLYSGTYAYTYGMLPQEWRDKLEEAQENGDVTYIVFSFETPIAWVLKDGTEVKPPVKYSVTTSKHQGKLYGPAIGTRSICRDCDLEIEYVPGRYGSWHDRGGNESCSKNGYKHLPND